MSKCYFVCIPPVAMATGGIAVAYHCKLGNFCVWIFSNKTVGLCMNNHKHESASTELIIHTVETYNRWLPSCFFPCRVMSLSNIYTWNVWLLLHPSPLCCDWSLGSLPLVTTLSDHRNVYSVVLYASLAAMGLRLLRGTRCVCVSSRHSAS